MTHSPSSYEVGYTLLDQPQKAVERRRSSLWTSKLWDTLSAAVETDH